MTSPVASPDLALDLDPLERVTEQMTSTLDLDEVLATITTGLVEDLGAALARIWLLDARTSGPPTLHLTASAGLSSRLDGAHARVLVGALKIGQIAAERRAVCLDGLDDDPRITEKTWVKQHGLASFAGYPLLFRGELLGVLAMFARRALTAVELTRLARFANRAAIAVQNARVHAELAALKARLVDENTYLHEELRSERAPSAILGESAALREALDKLSQVAPTPSTVLLLGETGTGKELFARAIHDGSPRHDGPLVKVSCAAIAPSLIESELFGHEKGAFTGALARRLGRFERAHGGTLFLDEIGELPLETQAKLLRALEEREIDRVGGSASVAVDVRIVAATHRDLAAEVRAGRFRADLYYRLAVFPITLPPLRDRRDDVALLASAFIEREARALHKPLRGLTAEAAAKLAAYAFPGNVRELHNVIERAAILARGAWIGAAELPDLTGPREAPPPSANPEPDRRIEEIERAHIERVLVESAWQIEGPAGAAAALGLRPSTLRSRMLRFGVERPRR
ncbi:MAG: sigma 54-interacting transcriptional regulator [Byssovorax sp.]